MDRMHKLKKKKKKSKEPDKADEDSESFANIDNGFAGRRVGDPMLERDIPMTHITFEEMELEGRARATMMAKIAKHLCDQLERTKYVFNLHRRKTKMAWRCRQNMAEQIAYSTFRVEAKRKGAMTQDYLHTCSELIKRR